MSKMIISAIDAHAAGEGLRLITGGPRLKGRDVHEKSRYFYEKFDFIRTAAMHEPRGHNDIYGAVLTESCLDGVDFGIIFICPTGYSAMCGHAALCIGTIAVDTGIVPVREPVTSVAFETVAGLVRVDVEVKNGKTGKATLVGVPSFLVEAEKEIIVMGKPLHLDIVYGGNIFAIVDGDEIGLSHCTESIPEYYEWGTSILEEVNKAVDFCHPENKHIAVMDNVYFSWEPKKEGEHYKSLEFFYQIDRSPCGTGTSGKLAALYAKKKIDRSSVTVHESIIGSTFEGRIQVETKVGQYDAIVPLITCDAHITAFCNLVLDDDDPFKYGFTLEEKPCYIVF